MKLQIIVDITKLSEEVSVDDYIALEEGKMKGIKNVVSHFVFQNNKPMPYEKALKVLGELSLKELTELGVDFVKAAEEAASAGPKAQKESTEPTSQD